MSPAASKKPESALVLSISNAVVPGGGWTPSTLMRSALLANELSSMLLITPTPRTSSCARRRRSISATTCGWRAAGYRSMGRATHTRPPGAEPNPASTCDWAAKLRRNNAAVTSRTNDAAVCATTRPLRIENRRPSPPVFSLLSVPTTSGRVAWSAGSNPNKTPAITVVPITNASTFRSSATSRLIGSGMGRSAVSSACNASRDSAMPNAPPASATTSDSTRSCCTSARPVARLRQQKARQIRARDDEHQADHDHERRRRGHDHVVDDWIHRDLRQRRDAHARAGTPLLWMQAVHVAHEALDHRRRRGERRAIRQPHLGKERVVAALRQLVEARRLDRVDHLHRHEHRWQQTGQQSFEGLRCHADDGERASAQMDLAPNDAPIAAERAHPVVVAEHHDRVRTARDVVPGSEQTPNDRLESDEREVVAFDELAGERFDVIAGVAREHGELRNRHLAEHARRLVA